MRVRVVCASSRDGILLTGDLATRLLTWVRELQRTQMPEDRGSLQYMYTLHGGAV